MPWPEAVVNRRVAMGVLRVAIANLEPRQRQALESLHLLGLSVSETARQMGVSRQAVYNLESRAMPNLVAEIDCLLNKS